MTVETENQPTGGFSKERIWWAELASNPQLRPKEAPVQVVLAVTYCAGTKDLQVFGSNLRTTA
jgi:hypothetical protein